MRWTSWLRSVLSERVQSLLVLAGIAGVLGACASVAFTSIMTLAARLLTGSAQGLITAAQGMPWWERLAFPTIGGLVAGAILMIGARIRGPSSTDYMEAIVVGNGLMGFRQTLAKAGSSLVTIVSGGSIGREGSMVQLGALLASILSRTVTLPVSSRPLVVACGAAAGMACVYNAPLASAVFVAEVVMGTMAVEVLGPLLLAAVVSSALTRVTFLIPPLYVVHSAPVTSLWQILLYCGLGVLAAVLAPLYLGSLEGARRLFIRLPGAVCWKLGLGGALVGMVSLVEVHAWGNGNSVIDSLLHDQWLGRAVIVLVIGKIIATAATSGSGGVGGVFTPTLCLGAALGVGYSKLCMLVVPGMAPHADACAMIGMGTFLAACTQAPVMAMLMVFEMTLDDTMVLPLMLACIISHNLVQLLHCPPLYSMGGKQRERTAAQPEWSRLRVRDLLKPTGPVVANDSSFGDIALSFSSHSYSFIFVQDRVGTYCGAISIHDIKEHLTDLRLGPLAIAADLLITLPALLPDHDLSRALEAFGRHPGNRLPVVDRQRRLVGCVHKYDVMVAFAHGTASTETLPVVLNPVPRPEDPPPTSVPAPSDTGGTGGPGTGPLHG